MRIHPMKLARAVAYGWLLPRRRHCIACGRGVGGFLPYRNGSASLSDAIRALDVSGSDVDNFECPRCGANDRLRHLLMYMGKVGLFERIKGARVLHFAPEKALAERIRQAGPARYVLADIAPPGPEVERVDMTAMAFEAESFEVIIANHVLEHVGDLPAALSELNRVLAPGGVAILQTPFSQRLLTTFEDAGINTDDARLVLYGQEDHVRMFGSDIAAYIAGLSGLRSKASTHAEILPDIDPWAAGVNAAEPLLLFAKD
ncbi:SAM-dependent methyltransferase [Luteibacter sp. 621]|jgi:SAM-dependent methyltransferase|uniref:class I SAM-dependent methyltransferase n=1 Tax=Luteibacter sp. 621 TaxID=3373916 RepID=UPI003D1A9839